jgi:2-phospho-L-lactate/phosphoenolpyruvate guanylyltransferase
LQVAAIIPVKTFSKAKTRLGLPQDKTEELCTIMLDEVLSVLSSSECISKTVLVSKDEAAFKIGRKYNAVEILDEHEKGVNVAVALAERYLANDGIDTSVVFPQDIPMIMPQDVEMLLAFQKWPNSMLVVPSRKFDGTNALVRNPVNVVETHYDEDSYKIHLTTGKMRGVRTSFVLISRIMWDVDDKSDVGFIMRNMEKQNLAEKMQRLFGDLNGDTLT